MHLQLLIIATEVLEFAYWPRQGRHTIIDIKSIHSPPLPLSYTYQANRFQGQQETYKIMVSDFTAVCIKWLELFI